MTENPSETKTTFKWRHPSEVMAFHKLKKKKKQLAERIRANPSAKKEENPTATPFASILTSAKRKNPFICTSDSKRSKTQPVNLETEESADQTLFKLLHIGSTTPKVEAKVVTTFSNILSAAEEAEEQPIKKELIKVLGEKWVPIDWALKTKLRFLSLKPFAWNQKLKISEEASGITSFTRCLDTSSTATSLDTSPNAKFHQCCLYWQHPSLPWISLYPRIGNKAPSGISMTSTVREHLHNAWMDSFRSLFQLIRTRQCPYFYLCANSFTVLFRAAGICGFAEMHALITPTTRGFRNALSEAEIEFSMPLKTKTSENGVDNDDDGVEEDSDEKWLESLGINSEEIKQITYTQDRIERRAESEVDNSEESLVYIEGLEVQGLYSFLIHCKSAVALTGTYAGIPPTLLAPVAYNGATLSALKVRESKVHIDGEDLYSIDISGPILPNTIHNLCSIHPNDISMTATFSHFNPTIPFSKVARELCEKTDPKEPGCAIFRKENLSDCGIKDGILKHFCSDDPKTISNMDCLKYTTETNSYAWT